MVEQQHSEVGASSAHRWMRCPGSVALSREVPPKLPSKYAEEGTQAHKVAESYLRGEIKSWATLDEEMLEAAKIYASVIINDLLETENIQHQLKLESKVQIHHPKRDDLFGTCDAWFCADDTLYIYDFKYGKGVKVYAKENEQLLYYALGVIQTFGLDVAKVVLTIVQPRMENISRWECRATYISSFFHILRDSITYVEENPNKFNAGSHCKFCPALGVCEAAKKKIDSDFENIYGTGVTMADLSPDQIADYIEKGEYLSSWLNAVKEYAKNMLENGLDIPGYSLIEGQSNRKYTDEQDVIRQFSAYGDDLYDKKLKTPAKLEKLVGKGNLDDFVFRESTGKKLVRVQSDSAIGSGFVPFTEGL